MKLDFEANKRQAAEIRQLIRDCGAETPAELINEALTLLAWAVEKVKGGWSIAALSPDKDRYRSLDMAFIRALRGEKAPEFHVYKVDRP